MSSISIWCGESEYMSNMEDSKYMSILFVSNYMSSTVYGVVRVSG